MYYICIILACHPDCQTCSGTMNTDCILCVDGMWLNGPTCTGLYSL